MCYSIGGKKSQKTFFCTEPAGAGRDITIAAAESELVGNRRAYIRQNIDLLSPANICETDLLWDMNWIDQEVCKYRLTPDEVLSNFFQFRLYYVNNANSLFQRCGRVITSASWAEQKTSVHFGDDRVERTHGELDGDGSVILTPPRAKSPNRVASRVPNLRGRKDVIYLTPCLSMDAMR